MYHYLLELAFWILLAFFAGCFLGGWTRMKFGAAEEVVPVAASPAMPAKLPVEEVAEVRQAVPKKRAPAKAKPPAKRATKRPAKK